MRIAIGPSSFAAVDSAPLDRLLGSGFEVVPNPFGRRLDEQEITAHLVDIDGLIAGLEPLNRAVLSTADGLRAIARVGVGTDTVDLFAAEELGIRVSNTPAAPASAVAEATVGAMVSLCRAFPVANAALHDGRWEKIIGRSLSEAIVLIVGYGRIGQEVASLLRAFGATVLACDPNLDHERLDGAVESSFEEGLRQADVITLHAGGSTPILDADAFAEMSPGAVVLNSGRGELIDEPSLIAALDSGIVAGAWLDVFSSEPYVGPLAQYEQVILTPHMATYTRQTRRQMELEAVENLIRDLQRPM